MKTPDRSEGFGSFGVQGRSPCPRIFFAMTETDRSRESGVAVKEAEIKQRMSSWTAHAEHAETWRLRHALFRGGWFDLSRESDGPPVGGVLCGEYWNNKPQNARSAKRSRNDTTNRNNNGFRLATTLLIAGANRSSGA